ncbi:MAG: SigB/SigF/SigG family RNA polymerase sigma factor [Limnochordia bacterium]|jgi:RNA polymerase sporulation-specific sigma factor|nr:SigB/SigF/SigG family RNA polymerase sigma factor [Limnochordia bacterium]MDI9464383.1 SigB/SigF/SigG family RNA polymerase sigma factor [Bacillota bacterium]HOB41364.1 SigB/SigF/SigG family RNA polymerase sigma factor [Limnochordia bacterium]HOK31296.1 SigB/SigF/SigG family RNA polymerase sigma factor [Limnochordia bacterium]HOM00149.1 SigB/SigF/SigG family RNA polymerase sigma factor [Limnochordia bacterium]
MDMEQTRRLIAQAQQGDVEARGELVEANLPLVHNIARRFADRGVEWEDLVQIGALGLLKAIEDFDFSFDVQFSTFAVPKIMGEIRQHLRSSSPLKISRSLRKLASEALRAQEALEQSLGRSPTISEIAEQLNTAPEEVVCALEAVAPVYSLQSTLGSGDDDAPALEDVVAVSDSQEHFLLRQALEKLEPEERRLILLRYFAEKSQSQVAEEFGTSQAQISRMEARIIRQLRHDL